MTILTELHQDHVNLNKLLVMLRQNADTLREGKQPNYSLMGDVVEYISSYADGFHHPREDQMYEYFQGRSAELDKALSGCHADHLKLKQSSLELREAIDGVLHDAVMPIDEFINLLDNFVALQIEHLNEEEGQLFPLLEEVGSNQDWAVLSEKLPAPEDPLFGVRQAQQYSELYKEMLIEMNYA